MRTARARATEPKPRPFLLNLFRSPQTYLRSAVPYPPASQKKAPHPQAGFSLFGHGKVPGPAPARPRTSDYAVRREVLSLAISWPARLESSRKRDQRETGNKADS
jgi:hypothetical protein